MHTYIIFSAVSWPLILPIHVYEVSLKHIEDLLYDKSYEKNKI